MRGWLISCLLLAAGQARADCPRTGRTIPAAHGPVAVDGKLDDPTWTTACFIDDFEQKQPAYGERPTRRVTTAVAIDRDTLYVAARMWSAGPGDIDDALTQRDDTGQAERFIVSIDPAHSRRVAYSFAVTAAGVRDLRWHAATAHAGPMRAIADGAGGFQTRVLDRRTGLHRAVAALHRGAALGAVARQYAVRGVAAIPAGQHRTRAAAARRGARRRDPARPA